jgi:LysR family transcriptional regulator, hydrogen peroxide-inducible genes activator
MAGISSLRQLQYLVTLSEKLNFTRAAEACFVTQSTLSAGLKELEQALGVRLVERDRQRVLMTPIGLEVVRRARAILAAAQDLEQLTAGAQAPMSGMLRLGVIPTIAPFLLPALLQPLREGYPKLRLALREDLTANLLARLEEGQIDMALIALPFETSHLLVKPLFDDTLWIVGRKDEADLRARAVAITPSLTDRMLLLEEGHCLREHALYACPVTARPHAGGVEATSLLTLVQMVESGFGIGLVPEMAVRSGLTKSPRLVARPLAKPSPTRTIALVARRSSARLADFEAIAALIQKTRPR